MTAAQIHGLSVSRQELRTAVGQGRLERVERGIYRLVGQPPSWKSRLLAHCWATGGRACGATAAMLHDLGAPKDLSPGFAEVLVPLGRRPGPRANLRIRREREFDMIPTLDIGGIPVLPITETLLSVGLHHPFERFRAVVNEARRQRRITLGELAAAAGPLLTRGRRHRRHLGSALDRMAERPTLSHSEWSDEFADWCEQRGLPRPELEFRILDDDGTLVAQVDLCWPLARVVVELDSWAWHNDRASFESDRHRYGRLAVQGWTVIAVTWKRWKGDSDGLARDLASALA